MIDPSSSEESDEEAIEEHHVDSSSFNTSAVPGGGGGTGNGGGGVGVGGLESATFLIGAHPNHHTMANSVYPVGGNSNLDVPSSAGNIFRYFAEMGFHS